MSHPALPVTEDPAIERPLGSRPNRARRRAGRDAARANEGGLPMTNRRAPIELPAKVGANDVIQQADAFLDRYPAIYGECRSNLPWVPTHHELSAACHLVNRYGGGD